MRGSGVTGYDHVFVDMTGYGYGEEKQVARINRQILGFGNQSRSRARRVAERLPVQLILSCRPELREGRASSKKISSTLPACASGPDCATIPGVFLFCNQ
jgi:hypothetical protein